MYVTSKYILVVHECLHGLSTITINLKTELIDWFKGHVNFKTITLPGVSDPSCKTRPMYSFSPSWVVPATIASSGISPLRANCQATWLLKST